MIVKELSFWDFKNEFEDYGRENQFSEEGLEILYEYLVGWAEETGAPIVLDVIGLCCDFAEYSDIEEYNREYDETFNTPEELGYYHNVIGVLDDGGFVVVAH